MKPAQERNQESLPPKKRDLPLSNSGGVGGTGGGGAAGGAGNAAGGGNGEAEVASIQNSGASSDTQGGNPSGEWSRAHPEHHYGVDISESISAGHVDQYSMIYKVAVPSVTYSSTSLHPVLSHISPAYTVHSPLLQHAGLPYPPLGYAHIPHPSLQFVSSPYAAVPYAVPSGFVPGSLISPSGTIPQPHAVSHLVPYPSVIQDGVVSPPPQAQAHTFTKVAAPSGVPLIMPSEQAAQQHIGTIGVIPAPEISSGRMPVYYQHQGSRGVSGTSDCHNLQQGNEAEINGGDKEQGVREVLLDSAYTSRNAHVQQVATSSAAQEHSQERVLQNRRLEGRISPGQPSTPDSDLEVQQVVGRLGTLSQGVGGVRKEVSFAPLNLSQGAQRTSTAVSGRAVHAAQPLSYSEHKMTGLQQQSGQPGHAVMLTNGQPVLINLDYHLQHQPQLQQHYPGQANEASATASKASINPSFKTSDSSGRAYLHEKVELTTAKQHHLQQQPSLQASVHSTAEVSQASSVAPAAPTGNPSHFMKGAIIQLATGELKRVEDLQTQDFVRSAEVSGGLKIDSSMVMDIRPSQQRPGLVSLHFTVGEQQSKVTIDVPPEHPFFVFGQGWSSCSPERTAQLYGLTCHHLQVGDVCVSITLQQQQQQQLQPQHHNSQQQQNMSRTLGKTNTTSGPGHQLMGPPAPQQLRPQAHFRMDRTHRERQRDGERDVVEKDEAQLAVVGHSESPIRRGRTSTEHPRSQSSYHLHTEGSAFAGTGMAAMQAALGASQRRWSSPGLQRYSMKGDEGSRPHIITSGHTRPSFIPQEVKLSIEGRSNAGK
ncbi:ataxin-1-like [Girardinichthys multiradiatus]|uniref:ataxin-1-like n=1 Tax=Girardinichthys multiradiatus TaxID=208333 RepID=UPI001FAD9351|nr:ataxin-1-like [Girardinichthys multiradiatus]XP_047219745.1 ataxin-1-like [Girardinichthys multiradiatus]